MKNTFTYSSKYAVTNAEQNYTIRFDREGRLACLQVFSVTPTCSVPVTIDFGYSTGANFVPFYTVQNVGSGISVLFPNEVYMLLDVYPAVRVRNANAGDSLLVVVTGYIA